MKSNGRLLIRRMRDKRELIDIPTVGIIVQF